MIQYSWLHIPMLGEPSARRLSERGLIVAFDDQNSAAGPGIHVGRIALKPDQNGRKAEDVVTGQTCESPGERPGKPTIYRAAIRRKMSTACTSPLRPRSCDTPERQTPSSYAGIHEELGAFMRSHE
jgi:hypothetical protein